MRHKLTITAILAFAIAALVVTQMPTAWVSAQPEAAVQKAHAADRTPPDIKEGVKISFVGAKAGAGVNAGEPAELEGWVNFETVGWYRIEKK